MATELFTVTLAHTSGLIENAVQQSFVFSGMSGVYGDAQHDAVISDVQEFYNTVNTNGSTVANLLSSVLDRGANKATIKVYDISAALDGSPHGSPRRTVTFTLGAAQGGETNLPAEVAVVLSTHGFLIDVLQELGNTRPAARRRGRLYMGPVNTLCRTIDATTGKVTVSSSARTTLTQAAARLITQGNGVWAVWSRANADTSPVSGGFVDDAFDTQRSRGERATLRTTF